MWALSTGLSRRDRECKILILYCTVQSRNCECFENCQHVTYKWVPIRTDTKTINNALKFRKHKNLFISDARILFLLYSALFTLLLVFLSSSGPLVCKVSTKSSKSWPVLSTPMMLELLFCVVHITAFWTTKLNFGEELNDGRESDQKQSLCHSLGRTLLIPQSELEDAVRDLCCSWIPCRRHHRLICNLHVIFHVCSNHCRICIPWNTLYNAKAVWDASVCDVWCIACIRLELQSRTHT